MRIRVNKDLTQLPYDLVWDETGRLHRFKESADSEEDLVINSDTLDELSKLQIVSLPSFPPEEFQREYGSLVDRTPPWPLCMTRSKFVEAVTTFVKEIETKLPDLAYYRGFYKQSNLVLDSLEPGLINVDLFNTLHTIDPTVASFRPDEHGFAPKPTYSRVDTVTGRLTVLDGPQILHLKKELRPNLLRSRFGEEGTVYELDYKSLEPRVLLAEAGYQEIPDDVYEHTRKEVFSDTDLTRDSTKTILLNTLYGATVETIATKINKSTYETSDAIGSIEEMFKIDTLRDKLIKENETNNREFVVNHYGRKVSTTQARNSILVNRYAQSTAIDLALCGFSEIVSYLKGMGLLETVVPLYVIQDALYLDVHNSAASYTPTLCKVGSVGLSGFENNSFYLKSKKLIY